MFYYEDHFLLNIQLLIVLKKIMTLMMKYNMINHEI